MYFIVHEIIAQQQRQTVGWLYHRMSHLHLSQRMGGSLSSRAKQRKMADFDPSGNQNPGTDFDETWHG